MAQIISYGGYGNLEFSDEATDEQIQEYVNKNYKAIENRFDVPHSSPEGFFSSMLPDSLERGVLNLKKAFKLEDKFELRRNADSNVIATISNKILAESSLEEAEKK